MQRELTNNIVRSMYTRNFTQIIHIHNIENTNPMKCVHK